MTIGIALTGLLSNQIRLLERKSALTQFRGRVNEQAASLERELRLSLESLHSLKSFFDNSDQVTALEFGNFTDGILQRHPDISALEWAPRVAGADRNAFTDSMKKREPWYEIGQLNDQG
ncbi:MAG: CHASE domain-containing protein, partial [Fibrobacterota bacterium]|nr:CHASE domain-containing protein [Fibrobacterota bacterium]